MLSEALLEWAANALANQKAAPHRDRAQLSQLTIIIPSYRRQDFLARQVVFWARSRATVIIVDGSPDAIESPLRDLVRDIPNITYVGLVDTYANRLKDACRHVVTPYAMCLADDDFYLTRGLCAAIDHLNDDRSVLACIGQTKGVDYDHRRSRPYMFPYGGSLAGYQVVNADPAHRVRLGIANYRSATSYAVIRAPQFRAIWRGFQMTSCLEAAEYDHAISTYTLGNLSTVDATYWLRSFEAPPIDSPLDGSRRLDFGRWWHSPEYRDECVNYVNRLSAHLAECSALSPEEAQAVILEVVGYILGGNHTGLMDQTISGAVVGRLLKWIRSVPTLDRTLTRLKSTRMGESFRDATMAAIRGSVANGMNGHQSASLAESVGEIETVLRLMSEFYVALGRAPSLPTNPLS